MDLVNKMCEVKIGIRRWEVGLIYDFKAESDGSEWWAIRINADDDCWFERKDFVLI